jgi:hypothetical protein
MSAYEIHEWIHAQLHVVEDTVTMIQIDGPRRQVYINFVNIQHVHGIMQGQSEYKHSNGGISEVRRIDVAGMGTQRARIASLPPEINEGERRSALALYGEIREIQDEKWSNTYRYAVANGIWVVTITMTKHIPSHLTITGHRVLVSYDGHPSTCYGCGDPAHIYQACSRRSRVGGVVDDTTPTWANVVASGQRRQELIG